MSQEELIELGTAIIDYKGDEKSLESLCKLFDMNVPHPSGSNLFFYPENYNSRRDDIAKYNPTVQAVVDMCLSYKPIQL